MMRMSNRAATCLAAAISLAGAAASAAFSPPAWLEAGGTLTTLLPGDPTGGVSVASNTVPFSVQASGATGELTLSGTLLSAVLSGDPNNPLGGLTFVYQISLDASANDTVTALSLGAFDPGSIEVRADTVQGGGGPILSVVAPAFVSGGVIPDQVSRSADGSGILFSFASLPLSGGTPNSATLIIQTDSITCAPSSAILFGGQIAEVDSFAPLPAAALVPEPGCGLLLAGGFSLLAGLRFSGRRTAG